MKKTWKESYFSMLAAMLIFGTIPVFRRNLPLSSATLACVRGILGAAILSAIRLCSGKPLFRGIPEKSLWQLALIGAMMGINWMLLFEAYNYTSVATATLCYYMEPTLLILFSVLLFGEKLTPKKSLSALLSLFGMVLVSGILGGASAGPDNWKGILLGLASALLYTFVVLLNKRVKLEDDYARTVIQLCAAALVLLPGVLLKEDLSTLKMPPESILLLLVLGFIHTGIAYVMYFASLKRLPSQSVAILSYVDPVSALFFAAIFLKERLTLAGILGAVLIIGAALFSELSPKRKEKT